MKSKGTEHLQDGNIIRTALSVILQDKTSMDAGQWRRSIVGHQYSYWLTWQDKLPSWGRTSKKECQMHISSEELMGGRGSNDYRISQGHCEN